MEPKRIYCNSCDGGPSVFAVYWEHGALVLVCEQCHEVYDMKVSFGVPSFSLCHSGADSQTKQCEGCEGGHCKGE